MWVRSRETGTAEFVIDPAEAFARIDGGEAEPIDPLPARALVVADAAAAPKVPVAGPKAVKPKAKPARGRAG